MIEILVGAQNLPSEAQHEAGVRTTIPNPITPLTVVTLAVVVSEWIDLPI